MGSKQNDIIRRQVDALGIPSKSMVRKEIARHERNEAYRRLMWKLLAGIVLSAAVVVLVTNLWLAVLQIDGSSMNPLLQMNEIVVAVRGDHPFKNDIIAFTQNNQLHVKRVIAVGGDQVAINDNGVVSVNGQALDEPYVTELSLGSCDITFPFLVPSGAVFVLGDNRPQSMDSRNSEFGVVGREQIIGKVEFRIWPLPRFGNIR